MLHFAALALVAESVEHPERYWRNNVVGTLNLLDAMRAHGVGAARLLLDRATYGEPETRPDRRGRADRAGQRLRRLQARGRPDDPRRVPSRHGLAATSLRYFNVAGASGELGEDHEPETHLIPLVLQAAAGKREHIKVFGTDYPTRDGTAVRDYIHVEDLGDAHLLALDRARRPASTAIYNLGTGDGYTVREVIEAARRVTGRAIPARGGGAPRRATRRRSWRDATRAREELGWAPAARRSTT